MFLLCFLLPMHGLATEMASLFFLLSIVFYPTGVSVAGQWALFTGNRLLPLHWSAVLLLLHSILLAIAVVLPALPGPGSLPA